MKNVKLFSTFCIILAACTSQNSFDQTKFTKSFDAQMNEAKKYCLDKGFIGHEPEYRSCVIGKSSQIFNLSVESRIRGSSRDT